MECAHTSCKHRVEQEHPSVLDVLGQLFVEETRLARLFISLNQNLADAHAPAAISQTLLHGLSGTHDADTTDLALELDPSILATNGGQDLVLDDRQVVETLFDKQTNDSIGVEDEVCAVGIAVSNHTGN